jgi:hypothetical protein
VLEHEIVGICLFVEGQAVLKTGAAAARHRNSQKGVPGLFLRLQRRDPPCRAVGNDDLAFAGDF